MSMKKVMALLLTGAMAVSTLNMAAFAEETEAVTEAAAAEGSEIPLVVGINNFSQKFSQMFAESVPDQTIADLMTEGCGMGIKSLNRYLNQYTTAGDEARGLARKLIRTEENLVEDLRRFL